MNKCPIIKWPHFLWHSGKCYKDGSDCMGIQSFVPKEKKIVIIPPLTPFEGEVKHGDAEVRHD
jgi:hypothetical protein